LSDGDHFRMGGGVFGKLNLIASLADDFAPAFDNRSDGNFVGFPGIDRLVVGERHVKLIISNKLRRIALLEGAIGSGFKRAIHREYDLFARVKTLD